MAYYPRKLKVTFKKKLTIRRKLKQGLSCAFIARQYKVTRQYVWYIKREMLEQEKWTRDEPGIS
jgi:hypothetical protein